MSQSAPKITGHYEVIFPFLSRAERGKYKQASLYTTPENLLICELDIVGDLEALAKEFDEAQQQIARGAGPGAWRFLIKVTGTAKKREGVAQELSLPLLTFVSARPDEGADWSNDYGQVQDTSREGIERMRLRHQEIMFRSVNGNTQRLIDGYSKLIEAERARAETIQKDNQWLREELSKRDKILLELGVAQSDIMSKKVDLDISAKRVDLEIESTKKVFGMVETALPLFLNRAMGAKVSPKEKPLVDVLKKLFNSFTPEQFRELAKLFREEQMILFNEIMTLVEQSIEEPTPTTTPKLNGYNNGGQA